MNFSARLGKISFGHPLLLEKPILGVAVPDSAFGKEEGHDVVYMTVSGKPAYFQVVDIIERRVLRKFPLPTAESSWSHLTVPNGDVYIGGSSGGCLYRYSPATKNFATISSFGEIVLYGLCHDEHGRVYFGSYPNGKAGQYDPVTGVTRDYGTVVPGENYTKATAYSNGYLYLGTGMKGSIVRLNVETGEKETISLPKFEFIDETCMVSQLDVIGDYLAAGLATSRKPLLFYNLKQQQWSEKYFLNNAGLRLSFGKAGSGKAFFVQENCLMELDPETLTATDTGIAFSSAFRNSGWVSIPDDPSLPGQSLATVTWGGDIALINLETKKTTTIQCIAEGNPIPIQALERGPDGKLYMSGYPGGKGAVYSPETGVNEPFSLGQAEGMAACNNRMYLGVYPKASIMELDVTLPFKAQLNPRRVFSIPNQDRPFIMIGAENKLFIGTIPDYGCLGGSLTIYNPETGADPTVYENVVCDQSIVGLAVRDGKLYGSTTIAGGLGIEPTQLEAKVFIWDIETGTKLIEKTISIPGYGRALAMISGLVFGEDGLLWAAAGGAIFALHPDTLEVVKSKVAYPEVTKFGRWRPVYIRLGKDGLLYTTLNETLTVFEPTSLDFVQLAKTPLMTLGEDGNIYYAVDTELWKIEVDRALL